MVDPEDARLKKVLAEIIKRLNDIERTPPKPRDVQKDKQYVATGIMVALDKLRYLEETQERLNESINNPDSEEKVAKRLEFMAKRLGFKSHTGMAAYTKHLAVKHEGVARAFRDDNLWMLAGLLGQAKSLLEQLTSLRTIADTDQQNDIDTLILNINKKIKWSEDLYNTLKAG